MAWAAMATRREARRVVWADTLVPVKAEEAEAARRETRGATCGAEWG